MAEFVTCDFCGKGIEDTLKQNAWHGVIPHPGDMPHTGMCLGCAGDPSARAIRKRLGWAMTAFIDARIPIIRGTLSPSNRASFEKMSYEGKANVVTRMVAKGLIT
jgi:hypothetical protein